MTTHITVEEAQAFLESTKCRLPSLEPVLEADQANYVLGRLFSTFQTLVPTWTDQTNTPELVRSVIAMRYAGWFYDRQYSEVISEDRAKSYGALLREQAETLLNGIISGSIELSEVPSGSADESSVFYPTDVSSTTQARLDNTDGDNMSLGPPMFGVSKVF
jgi:hypothetical protein